MKANNFSLDPGIVFAMARNDFHKHSGAGHNLGTMNPPREDQSAGKRKRAPTLHGNPHIKTALVESAWSASRTKDSEFQDRYQRLKPKIGHKRAIVAGARILAHRVYEVLGSGLPYRQNTKELPVKSVRRLIRHHYRRLNHLHRWLNSEPQS